MNDSPEKIIWGKWENNVKNFLSQIWKVIAENKYFFSSD